MHIVPRPDMTTERSSCSRRRKRRSEGVFASSGGSSAAKCLAWFLVVSSVPKGGESALLRVGKPILWGQAMPHLGYVREHGVKQFVSRYQKVKGIANDELKWGDEVEYAILKVDHENKRVRVSTRADEVRKELQTKEDQHAYRSEGCQWMPEYGSWMLEGTPKRPLRGLATHLGRVERNMRLRRKRLLATLNNDEIAPTMTNFPLFGVGDFTYPPGSTNGPIAQSEYVPDLVINPHPRFGTLTANIRERRGRKVDIQVPLFEDENTPEFQKPEASPSGGDSSTSSKPPMIHMDAMAFGMGCCCLQVTFQARDMDESRYMFDQLAIVSPIMLALSASTPIHRGMLADTDARWNCISAAVDDRTEEELRPSSAAAADATQGGTAATFGEGQMQERDWFGGEQGRARVGGEGVAGDFGGARRHPKSRYDSISTFIYNCRTGMDRCRVVNKYNDIECPVDEPSRQFLLSQGMDEALSKHVAHLFSRDPLVIFEGRVEEVNDEEEVDHWENLQSTNWQTVRWKPPPPRESPNDPHVGWRTEFRSLEIQLTDFENAAYTVFIVLVTRVIITLDLNLYMPLSKVDENMRRAHARNAATEGRFFFRTNVDSAPVVEQARPPQIEEYRECGYEDPAVEKGEWGELERYSSCDNDEDVVVEELSVLEILMGKGDYPGLIPLVHAYMEYVAADTATIERVDTYLEHLRKRAAGEIMTTAAWLRKFVTTHPGYKKDSRVTDEIAYDLVNACQEIGLGKRECPELLGDRKIKELTTDEAWDVVLDSSKMEVQYRNRLIQKFVKRAAEQQRARDAELQSSVGNDDSGEGEPALQDAPTSSAPTTAAGKW